MLVEERGELLPEKEKERVDIKDVVTKGM